MDDRSVSPATPGPVRLAVIAKSADLSELGLHRPLTVEMTLDGSATSSRCAELTSTVTCR